MWPASWHPATNLPDPAMPWVVIAGLAAGIAHFVAVVGLIRARGRLA